jgi:hypothetical protein
MIFREPIGFRYIAALSNVDDAFALAAASSKCLTRAATDLPPLWNNSSAKTSRTITRRCKRFWRQRQRPGRKSSIPTMMMRQKLIKHGLLSSYPSSTTTAFSQTFPE